MAIDESAEATYQAVRAVIRRRKTTKVLGSIDNPPAIDAAHHQKCDLLVRQCIDDAGFAPFHFDRRVDGVAEPWRVHWVKQAGCRRISSQMSQWFTDLKPGNKMPGLLAACGCMILVTWIPQLPSANEDARKLEGINEEHLAAAAAFVENLLLLFEACGLPSYWSSGSLFRTPVGAGKLGVPLDQRLVACVFVDYTPFDHERVVELAGGGQRERRTSSTKWTREVEID